MIPLSLYVHIPWCLQKCPYCDFNSHTSPVQIPQEAYIDALIADLRQDLTRFQQREIHSIFFGGGTPSLFSAKAYERLLNAFSNDLKLKSTIEITLEANPGTIDQQRFHDYVQLGINRLSLGIQSFNPKHLKKLGRIHDDQQARAAISVARKAGFTNINLDVMHGLPNQTIQEGLDDLTTAISFNPEHISWYQLTIEPNTAFFKQQPQLPNEDDADHLEQAGLNLLAQHRYDRYEISAFCQNHQTSQHNLNYWLFGDYYGIGAGAHGKISAIENNTLTIWRTRKHRQPKEYIQSKNQYCVAYDRVSFADQVFEFMLNTSRLQQKIPLSLLTERTGCSLNVLIPKLKIAQQQGLLIMDDTSWQITEFGRRYTNNLQHLFLPS